MKIFQITISILAITVLPWGNLVLAQNILPSAGVSEDSKEDGFPCALSGGCEEDIISADPTFIQMPAERHAVMTTTSTFKNENGLVGEILVPFDGALVRANVPIFGRAYGKNFKEYRVEYGEGSNPTEWIVLNTSQTPQTHNVIPDDLYQSADLSIEGNLSTWDTGLKNYVYLPTHPPDHPVDFKGTYTVRLVVTSSDGQMVEDRVILHVGNVIPNAWGGIVESPDKQVRIRVPEQAITAPFRLMLIQATEEAPNMSEHDGRFVTPVYEVKEVNEQFTKQAILEMNVSNMNYLDAGLDRMAIYGYDFNDQVWSVLPSFYRSDRQSLTTNITHLHAYYVVMSHDSRGGGTQLAPPEFLGSQFQTVKVSSPISMHYLVKNHFENGIGEWSNRDGEFGGFVSLDDESTFDGTNALKIVNAKAGGNFAVNVKSTPFDVREFPVVQFDYRIEPDVRTSFYVKVAGRWYRIGFTDDDMELRNKRVNIADIGMVPGVIDDDAWHTARFNLYDMLRTKTGHTVVEEMIMADWDVVGYMKLQFGTNQKGATYYIDNFSISREPSAGLRTDENVILVDNFNQKKASNNFGQRVFTFYEPSDEIVRTAFNTEDASGQGHALALTYDVSKTDTHGGYVSTLPNLDLRGYHALTFAVKSIDAEQDLLVGLRDHQGNEQKVSLSVYLPEKIDTYWKHVVIPLTAFNSSIYWGAITNLSLSFQHGLHSKGMILVDDIAFHKHIRSLSVDRFEQWTGKNLLGGQHWTFASGAAAVNGTYTRGSPNCLYRLSFGGNIGEVKAYASDLLTYAGWSTYLGGIDCSRCSSITFRVRGAQGGETPNIYLDDGNFRWSVDLEDYCDVTTDWQSVIIPLDAFEKSGVDLTHLEELQVVFEWEQMSGTVYLDDVQLGEVPRGDP